jgi:hypothetical protein
MRAIDRAAGIPDRAAGALQGAADAARGTKHQARAWSAEHHPDDREAAARERWHNGLPARNHFERDVYRAIEAGISGIDRLHTSLTCTFLTRYRSVPLPGIEVSGRGLP